MSLAWIRVNASLLDDPEVRNFGKDLFPKAEPWMARAAAAGLLVALWGRLADHQPDGSVITRDDEQLEEWAQWKGKPGAFATAFRERFVDENGVLLEWEKYQGAALARREADRQRKENSRKRGHAVPSLADTPTTLKRISMRVPVESLPDAVRTSSRNGTVTGTSTKSGTAGPRGNVETVDNLVTSPGTRPATATPSGVVTRFTARFYRNATPARRADISGQMAGAMLSTGVQFQGKTVRAVDEDHLDQCCLEVMEDPPRDANAAFVFVLKKLSDTYLETLSARAKALAPPKPAKLPEGMAGDAPAGATPVRAALAGILDRLEHTEEGL